MAENQNMLLLSSLFQDILDQKMAKLPTLVPLSDEEQRLVSEVSADLPACVFHISN